MSSFRRILVCWDGSKDARQALHKAAHLAEQIGAEMVVLAVLNRPVRAEASDEAAEEMARRRREVAAEITAETARDKVPSTTRLRHALLEADHVALAIDAYVREHGFDLVVVGRHGLDRAVHARVGGVTEHEVRHCSCPVMVVSAA